MNMILISVILAFSVFGGSYAQVLFSGECPSVSLQEDFDVSRVSICVFFSLNFHFSCLKYRFRVIL